MSFADCPESLPEAALWHAKNGRPVFPCYLRDQPDGKVKKAPLTQNGFKDATKDPQAIIDWWRRWPEAAIGMPCGAASGLMIIDYDIAQGIDVNDVREELHIRFDLPETLLVRSVRGGLHEYVQFVPDVGRHIHQIHPTVDILGDGGYVILPPSRMNDGRAYQVVFNADPVEAPPALIAAIREINGKPNLSTIQGGLSSGEYKEDAKLWEELSDAGKWHTSQRTLVMRYINAGVPADMITRLAPAFRRAPFSIEQTVREIGVSARGAAKLKEREDPAPKPHTIPLIAYADMGLSGPPEWRIEGLLPKRGFGVMYGGSGTFKSFIALDLALTAAAGIPWRGKQTEQCSAAYVAAEGTYGIQSRVLAWREHRGRFSAQQPAFWLVPSALNLRDNQVTDSLIERIAEIRPQLVVIDTLARSFGGGQENDNQDMGLFVANCDRIAAAADGFVLAIHHTGKDEGRGARGSSVLKAAADVEISVSRGTGEQSALLRVTKMKDAEDGLCVSVRMVRVETASPLTGEVLTSLIPVTEDPAEPPADYRLGRNERVVLGVLKEKSPMRFGQIKKETAFDSSTLSRAIKSLSVKALIICDGDDYILASGVSEDE